MSLDQATSRTLEQREENGEVFAFLKADATALLDRKGLSLHDFLNSADLIPAVRAFLSEYIDPYLPEGDQTEICSIATADNGISESEFRSLYKDSFLPYLRSESVRILDEQNNVLPGKEKAFAQKLIFFSRPLILLTIKIKGNSSSESADIFEMVKRGKFRERWGEVTGIKNKNGIPLIHPGLGHRMDGFHTGPLIEAADILNNHQFIDL